MGRPVPSGGRLRVVTINTGKCDGPYRARLSALLAGLGALDVDVILAQEAFETIEGSASVAFSTPQFLATGLGMHLASFRLREKPREVEGVAVDSYSGLATLSRWPLSDVKPRALSGDPDDGDRGVLFTAVETPVGVMRTANTHLTHLRHRDDLRMQQAREIIDDPWWHGPARLRLLGGDLNARPEHEVHAVLRGAEGEANWANGARCRGLDSFEVAGDLSAAPTIRRETSGGVVEARLDYLYLLLGQGDDAAVEVSHARVVLDEPLGGVLPSDHFGVLAELTLA